VDRWFERVVGEGYFLAFFCAFDAALPMTSSIELQRSARKEKMALSGELRI
jgi:hypothetical protein